MIDLGLLSQGCNPTSVVFPPLCDSSPLTWVWLVPGVSQDIIMGIPRKIEIELLEMLHRPAGPNNQEDPGFNTNVFHMAFVT